MKHIDTFVTEKLHLTKDNIKNIGFESEYDIYWFGELENYKEMPDEFYEHRKSSRKSRIDGKDLNRNKPWYAVAIYMSLHPDERIETIRAAVWPGKAGTQSELFQGLKEYGLTPQQRSGTRRLTEFSQWKKPQWVSYPLW